MKIAEPRLRYHNMQRSGLFPTIVHLRSFFLVTDGETTRGVALVRDRVSETVCPRPCVRDRVSETVCPRPGVRDRGSETVSPRPCVRDRVSATVRPGPCVRDRVSETVCPRQCVRDSVTRRVCVVRNDGHPPIPTAWRVGCGASPCFEQTSATSITNRRPEAESPRPSI